MNFLLSNFLFYPHTNAEQIDAISSLYFRSLKDCKLYVTYSFKAIIITTITIKSMFLEQWRAQEFFRGVLQIQLRTEGRLNGDLGVVVP
jgi:hypothetical protein